MPPLETLSIKVQQATEWWVYHALAKIGRDFTTSYALGSPGYARAIEEARAHEEARRRGMPFDTLGVHTYSARP